MIKNWGILIVTFLYISTVCGFALNFHYCGNKVASVKIDASAKKCTTEAEKNMKCCKDKKVDVKVKDEHQAEQSQSLLSKIFAIDLPVLSFEKYFLKAQKALLEKLWDNSSSLGLPKINTSIILKNCNFRI